MHFETDAEDQFEGIAARVAPRIHIQPGPLFKF